MTSDVVDRIRRRAAAAHRRVVLPEAGDPRIQEAAEILAAKRLVQPVFPPPQPMRLGDAALILAALALGVGLVFADRLPALQGQVRLEDGLALAEHHRLDVHPQERLGLRTSMRAIMSYR